MTSTDHQQSHLHTKVNSISLLIDYWLHLVTPTLIIQLIDSYPLWWCSGVPDTWICRPSWIPPGIAPTYGIPCKYKINARRLYCVSKRKYMVLITYMLPLASNKCDIRSSMFLVRGKNYTSLVSTKPGQFNAPHYFTV